MRGMAWLSMGNAISMVLNAAMLMIAVRMVTPQQMGEYYFVVAAAMILQVVGTFGLSNASVHFVAGLVEPQKACATNFLLTVRLLTSLLFAAVILGVAHLLSSDARGEAMDAFKWYGPPLVFAALNYQSILGLAAAYKSYGSMSLCIVLCAVLRLACSWGLLSIGFGSGALLAGFAIAEFAASALLLLLIPVRKGLTLKNTISSRLWRFSVWDYAKSILGILNYRIADMVMMASIGSVGLSVYSTAQQVPDILTRMFESVRPVVLGYTSSDRLSIEKTSRILNVFLSFLVLGAFPCVVLARQIVPLLYSTKYNASAPIMQFLCLAVVFGLTGYLLSLMMLGEGRAKAALFTAIPQSVVMFASLCILVPSWGCTGAAASVVLMQATGVAAGLWIVAKQSVRAYMKLVIACIASTTPLTIVVIASPFVRSNGVFVLTGAAMLVVFVVMKAADGTFRDCVRTLIRRSDSAGMVAVGA